MKTAKLLQFIKRPTFRFVGTAIAESTNAELKIIMNWPNFVPFFSTIMQFTANARYRHPAARLPLCGVATGTTAVIVHVRYSP
jgi:hypothetical protein